MNIEKLLDRILNSDFLYEWFNIIGFFVVVFLLLAVATALIAVVATFIYVIIFDQWSILYAG